jgi:hypothetical protein
MDIRAAITPQLDADGKIELSTAITYDDLLDKLGELSAEFADLDFMVRLLKRDNNDVSGLDALLQEASNYIKTIGERLVLLKTDSLANRAEATRRLR